MILRVRTTQPESSLLLGNNRSVPVVNKITQPTSRIVGGGIGLALVILEEVTLVRNQLLGSSILVKEVLEFTPALLRANFSQAGL